MLFSNAVYWPMVFYACVAPTAPNEKLLSYMHRALDRAGPARCSADMSGVRRDALLRMTRRTVTRPNTRGKANIP